MAPITESVGSGPSEADFEGPAFVLLDDAEVPVTIALHGMVQPIDGVFRWYGRIQPSAELDAAIGTGNRPGRLRTSFGSADAVFGDRDFWDRYRVTGNSRPPFPTPFDSTVTDNTEAPR
ncbi:DUF4873 domain-containing protein [Aldersonia kunmingensis]|uniref:DUF4873 domain-containing protein n=1 Tax=Aldersonia kunmingensis TaxID=408066 RepID=UPI00082F5A91|nr:DUF4873 domain-containing protein [Aldersonia kunmingensis]